MFVCCSTDGYIVCEEHEEILRAAWVEEQELQKQKEKEVCVRPLETHWFALDLRLKDSSYCPCRKGKRG